MIIHEFSATAPQFAQCLAIRMAVFVQEQLVPLEDELDEYDHTARHFLALVADKPVATARLIMQPDGSARIGRIAVLASHRGCGIGTALMRHVESTIMTASMVLDSQVQAMPFYTALGYIPHGTVFLEAGILHCQMRKRRHP